MYISGFTIVEIIFTFISILAWIKIFSTIPYTSYILYILLFNIVNIAVFIGLGEARCRISIMEDFYISLKKELLEEKHEKQDNEEQ